MKSSQLKLPPEAYESRPREELNSNIILLILVDARGIFAFIDCGTPESVGDSVAFSMPQLARQVEVGK